MSVVSDDICCSISWDVENAAGRYHNRTDNCRGGVVLLGTSNPGKKLLGKNKKQT